MQGDAYLRREIQIKMKDLEFTSSLEMMSVSQMASDVKKEWVGGGNWVILKENVSDSKSSHMEDDVDWCHSCVLMLVDHD